VTAFLDCQWNVLDLPVVVRVVTGRIGVGVITLATALIVFGSVDTEDTLVTGVKCSASAGSGGEAGG